MFFNIETAGGKRKCIRCNGSIPKGHKCLVYQVPIYRSCMSSYNICETCIDKVKNELMSDLVIKRNQIESFNMDGN